MKNTLQFRKLNTETIGKQRLHYSTVVETVHSSWKDFKKDSNVAVEISMDKYAALARLPKDSFCRMILDRNYYITNHPRPRSVRMRELHKFRIQLKALETELLGMLPVNSSKQKLSDRTMIVVHGKPGGKNDDVNDKLPKSDEGFDMCPKKDQISLKDLNERYLNKMPFTNESEHIENKEILKIKNADKLNIGDKFGFKLRKCRIMLKRLKEFQGVHIISSATPNSIAKRKEQMISPAKKCSQRFEDIAKATNIPSKNKFQNLSEKNKAKVESLSPGDIEKKPQKLLKISKRKREPKEEDYIEKKEQKESHSLSNKKINDIENMQSNDLLKNNEKIEIIKSKSKNLKSSKIIIPTDKNKKTEGKQKIYKKKGKYKEKSCIKNDDLLFENGIRRKTKKRDEKRNESLPIHHDRNAEVKGVHKCEDKEKENPTIDNNKTTIESISFNTKNYNEEICKLWPPNNVKQFEKTLTKLTAGSVQHLYKEYVMKATKLKTSSVNDLEILKTHEDVEKSLDKSMSKVVTDAYEKKHTNDTLSEKQNSNNYIDKSIKVLEKISHKQNEPALKLSDKSKKRVIEKSCNLFKEPLKTPKIVAASPHEIDSSGKFKLIDSSAASIFSLLQNPFKSGDNKAHKSLIKSFDIADEPDTENAGDTSPINTSYHKTNWECKRNSTPTQRKEINLITSTQISNPFKSPVDNKRQTEHLMNDDDFIEVCFSDISSNKSCDEFNMKNNNQFTSESSPHKSSSGFSSASNMELSPIDIHDWDEEFMSMHTKVKNTKKAVTPNKCAQETIWKSKDTTKLLQLLESQQTEPIKIFQDVELADNHFGEYTRSYSYTDRSSNYLQWSLRLIDMPDFIVNKPQRFDELPYRLTYEDPRLYKYKSLTPTFDEKMQNVRNRSILWKTLKNSKLYSNLSGDDKRDVTKLLLFNFIRSLEKYQQKSMTNMNLEFGLNSIENAREIAKLLDLLNLSVNQFGDVIEKTI